MSKLNPYQRAALKTYSGGEYAHLAECESEREARVEIADLGDGFLTYLLIELSDKEDCESAKEALMRLQNVIDDAQCAFDAVTAMPVTYECCLVGYVTEASGDKRAAEPREEPDSFEVYMREDHPDGEIVLFAEKDFETYDDALAHARKLCEEYGLDPNTIDEG